MAEESDAGCGPLKEYRIRGWPFPGKRYVELTEQEGKEAFAWFLSTKEERLSQLRKAVGVQDQTLAASLNFSSESIATLGEWFSHHVHLRKAFDFEIQKERELLAVTQFARKVDRPTFERAAKRFISPAHFTSETISLEHDIGIYFGEALIAGHVGARWVRSRKKRFHLNQPILDGFQLVAPLDEVDHVAHVMTSPEWDEPSPLAWHFTLRDERWKGRPRK